MGISGSFTLVALEPWFHLSSAHTCFCPWPPHEGGAGGDWMEGMMDIQEGMSSDS